MTTNKDRLIELIGEYGSAAIKAHLASPRNALAATTTRNTLFDYLDTLPDDLGVIEETFNIYILTGGPYGAIPMSEVGDKVKSLLAQGHEITGVINTKDEG